MTNYQLKRTNVLLGGQMKYDFIINDGKICDFHITPISNHVPFNRYIKEDLLTSPHGENIKLFHSKTSSSFYKDFTDPLLTSLYPLPSDTKLTTFTDDTYDAGCEFLKEAHYNKTIEVFCPVWLEHIEKASDLKFEFQVLTKNKTPIHTINIGFDTTIIEGKVVEGKLAQYFTQYFKNIGLDKGCDWVMDINFEKCVASGVNVSTGIVSEKTLTNLYEDLTYRERPLLEFNSMIINSMKNHNLITKQLFNFNFCLNLSDLLKGFVHEAIKGHSFDIQVKVKVKDVELEQMDLFTNHDFIERQSTIPPTLTSINGELKVIHTSTNLNVLDYMKDDKYIGFIEKNKIIQNICHWCLSDNSTEHFNLYNGFAPINIDNPGTPLEIPYYNGETANLIVSKANPACYPYWCNNYIVLEDFLNEFVTTLLDKTSTKLDWLFSDFTNDCWVKNIHYKSNSQNRAKIIVLQSLDPQKLITLCKHNNWTIYTLNSTNTQGSIDIAYFENESKTESKVIIITPLLNTNNIEPYLYRNIMGQIKNEQKSNDLLSKLYELLSSPSVSSQKLIKFQNGLTAVRADSPSLESTEIDYYKCQSQSIIIRNFGRIKPLFISDYDLYKNYKYEKQVLDDENIGFYRKYIKSKYLPKYPSIDYFAFKRKE